MIKTTVLKFITEKKYDRRYAEKLRGYFAEIYREEDIFHNHNGEKVVYRMPLIQYKVIDGNLAVIGINEGAELVAKEFLKHKRIPLKTEKGEEYLENFETNLSMKNEEFYISDELHSYKFDSIWLALNEDNHKKYKKGEINLDKILIGNILSNLKGCGITADKNIMAKGEYKTVEVDMKNNEMIGFTGSFVTNAVIPEYMSLGKRRAIGYGAVVKK